MVDSIVKDILSRAAPQEKKIPSLESNMEEEELIKILSTLKTNIKVIGCGGGGSNTISRLVESGITGAELYAANTDAQHLLALNSPHKILLGRRSTRGLGAGALPKVGEAAAVESEEELKAAVSGADLVFITCGLGGGTGTGSAPFIAKLAKDAGALTIAVCTLPFKAEGIVRMENALEGLEKLTKTVDTVITVPNEKLLEIAPRLPLNAAFRVADEVLARAIKGITEIITKPGLVNLDFNDLKTIMKGGGVALIGLGESESENRAEEAVKMAIHSPLIDVDISNANGALINVVGGADMTLSEAQKVAQIVHDNISQDARIIWGASVDESLQHEIRVMVVITGVKSRQMFGPADVMKVRSSTEIDTIG
jgi:cell division protein FtsZ